MTTTHPTAPGGTGPAGTPVPLRQLTAADSQEIFHTLMEVLSRPGTIGHFPDVRGADGELYEAVLLPLLAMTDLMVSVTALPAHPTSGPQDRAAQHIAQIARVTGAPVVPAPQARFALAVEEPGEWTNLNTGSDWSPELGAMLIQQVDDLTLDDPAPRPDAWRLSGPGIPAESDHVLSGTGLSRRWVETRNQLCAGYPRGVDVVLVTADGRVTGVPRTTIVDTFDVSDLSDTSDTYRESEEA